MVAPAAALGAGLEATDLAGSKVLAVKAKGCNVRLSISNNRENLVDRTGPAPREQAWVPWATSPVVQLTAPTRPSQ